MKAGTHNHMKTKRLKRLLGIPLYQAVGILESLWLLCTDCCDEGNIGKFTDEEIADYLEWDGDASELVRALSDSGWTDSDKDRRLVIHDWIDHCPEYIRDRIRKRQARSDKASKPHDEEIDPNNQRTYASSEPDKAGQSRTDTGHDRDLTVYSKPIPTHSNPTNTLSDKNEDKQSEQVDGFILKWNSTPGVVKVERLRKGKRLSSLKARLHEKDWNWQLALTKFPLKCFAETGEFTPHLEWFTRPDTVDRILEGTYDWTKSTTNGHPPPPPPRVIGVPEPVQFLPGRGPPKPKEETDHV